MKKKYWINAQLIQQSGKVPSECNSITFLNTSLIDTVLVLNVPIAPGQSLSIQGNEDEIDMTDYLVQLGTDPNTFYVLRKFYKQ